MDNNRTVSKTFAVTSSWQRFIINFGKDTTGAFDDDNASSLQLRWYLHAGTNYTGGTLQEEWGAVTNNETAGGMTSSFFSSTDNTFFLTGVQLEIGSQATNFEHRSIGEELALCYRYTQRHPSSDSGENFNVIAQGMASSATATFHPCRHYVTMRAEPSLTNSGNFRVRYAATAVGTSAATTLYDDGSNSDISFLLGTVGSGLTVGHSIILEQNNDVDAHIILDAEL